MCQPLPTLHRNVRGWAVFSGGKRCKSLGDKGRSFFRGARRGGPGRTVRIPGRAMRNAKWGTNGEWGGWGYSDKEEQTSVGRVACSGNLATTGTFYFCASWAFCGQISSSPHKAQKPRKRRHHCAVVRVRFGLVLTLRLGANANRRLSRFT
jgi:hypothetical protein